jgi:hypothetical protein
MAITGAEPVAYWPLGDNSNPTANAGYPNTSVGADSVFDFDSTSPGDYINIGVPNFLSATSTFTSSLWFNTDDVNSQTTLWMVGSSASQLWGLSKFEDDLIIYGGSSTKYYRKNTLFNINTWYNLIVVYDGSQSNANRYKAYLNGVLLTSPTIYGTIDTTTPTFTTDLNIGRIDYAAASYFNGKISNVQIWDTPLSGPEAETLYNNGQPIMTGAQPQATNLKAWYKLNQSSNWEADSAGNWQIPDATSAFPQSFKFISSDTSQINLGDVTYLDGASELTLSAWVKPTAAGTAAADAIFGKDGPTRGFYLATYTGNKFRFFVSTTGSSNDSFNSNASYTIGEWIHLAATWDGSNMKIYINGSEDNTRTTTNATGTLQNNSNSFEIGNLGNYNGPLNAFLSNAQVWTTALPATGSNSIETLYNNGLPLTTAIATDNLKAWYKLDNTETYLKPAPSQTQNLYEAWLVENQKYPASVENCLLFGQNTSTTYDNFNLINEPELTVSFWYLHDNSVNTSDKVLGSRDNTAYNFYVNVVRSGAASVSGGLRTNDGAGGFVNNSFSFGNISTPTVGWRLLTLTYNGSVIKAYVNNEEVDSLSATGTIYDLNPYIGGSRNYNQSIRDGNGSANGMRMSNVIYWNKALEPSELTTLYNNGTPLLTKNSIPQNSSMLLWNTLENKTETIGGGLYDKSGNSVSIQGITNPSNIIVDNVPVSAESVLSSGMTEQSLVYNNVSVKNGESSGMNTTNIVQSNLTRTVPYSNYSVNFSGTGDYIDCTDISYFSGADRCSLSVWFKVDSSDDGAYNRDIISKGSSIAGTTSFFIRKGKNTNLNKISFSFDEGTTNVYSTTQIQNDVWYHVAVVYKGYESNNADRIKIYVNGQNDTASYTTTIPTTLSSSTQPFRIARWQSAIYDFNGLISNVCAWESVITDDDVINLYNNGITQNLNNFRVTPDYWWPLDQNSTYFNGSVLIGREVIGALDGTGVNVVQSDIHGTAPGSEASGTGNNLTIADLKGNMYNSDKNAYSINMADYADGVTNPANSGKSTDTPS